MEQLRVGEGEVLKQAAQPVIEETVKNLKTEESVLPKDANKREDDAGDEISLSEHGTVMCKQAEHVLHGFRKS